jgi:transcription elongation GreA/GreB family factor
MSLEGLKAFFEIGGVVLLLFTFAFGAGALIVNNRLNAIQATELGDFRIKFEGEQQKTALAQKEAAEAKQIAGGFETAISAANQRAAEANAKAEEFRLDIAKSNQRAAEAVQKAEEERLARIKIEERMKPRSFKPNLEAMSALKAYKGTEYTFSSVYADEESIALLKQLDAILLDAGWTRVKPPHAYPAINVYGQEQDFAVASSLRSGIRISVDSDKPITTLQAIPIRELPAPAGAAVVLAMKLTASLIPPQDDGVKANVEAGESMTVRIEIGSKP